MSNHQMIRVFPRKTKWTPTDELAFVGEPGLFRPPVMPVRISVTFTWDIPEAERLFRAWSAYYPDVQIGGPAFDDPGDAFTPGQNVSFDILNRDVVKNNPHWKWTDKQYAFKDRWFRACYKKRDAYITLPTFPVFHKGGGVTIGTRKRFSWGSSYFKKFANWKKVLVRDMIEFYDSTVDPV